MGKKKSAKRPEPASTEGFTERDKRVYYNGRVCYLYGEDGLEFLTSLKAAAGRMVWYNSAESQVFMKWEYVQL